MAQVAHLLDVRNRALAIGDRALVRAVNADLERMGYSDPPVEQAPAPEPQETTQHPGLPERAVPPKPRARPRKQD